MWREVMWLPLSVVMTRTLVRLALVPLLRNRCREGRCPFPGPGPRRDEARRHCDGGVLGPELRGGEPDDVAEGPAEGAQAGEPDVPRHVRDGPVGLAQERHRPLDPAAL